MNLIYCPGCSHKMSPDEYSCPVCGYTEMCSYDPMDLFGEIGGEFDVNDAQFLNDDF
ncbi:hypothetical protein ACFL6B_04695 [Thermodesulfobacteriota bacterium]